MRLVVLSDDGGGRGGGSRNSSKREPNILIPTLVAHKGCFHACPQCSLCSEC